MSLTNQPDLAPVRPTRTRYIVVALAVALAMVTYLDRACIATLAPEIMRDLDLSKAQMSWVYSAFALAYAVFEIPTAAWADRVGTRNVLTRIVIWWSSFTMATATAFSHGSLLVIRFLFGIGEAGAWPTAARTFSRWIPRQERGTVQGIFFAGAHLAGGLTPSLVLCLLWYLNWRAIFILFGGFGFVWAACWHAWFRDDPAEHPQVNTAELSQIVAGREAGGRHSAGWDYWRRLLSHRNIWALCLMYFPNSFAFYFCITWLPTYLQEKHGFAATALGILSGLPLVLSVVADLFGGVTTDWAVARFGAASRSVRCRRPGISGGRIGRTPGHRLPTAPAGRRVDCRGDGGQHVRVRGGLGHLSGHRWPSRGRGQCCHEHLGPDRGGAQPALGDLSGRAFRRLERTPVSDRRPVLFRCGVLVRRRPTTKDLCRNRNMRSHLDGQDEREVASR